MGDRDGQDRDWRDLRRTHELRRQATAPPPTTRVPVPERITMALDRRGLDGPEVDIALGGAEPMVDEWEAGTRVPTAEQVAALADLTGMLPGFFYQPIPDWAKTGGAWVCQRSGRGKGCTFVPPSPGPSDADVVELHPDTLF